MSAPLAAMVQVPSALTVREPGRLVPMSTLFQPAGSPVASTRVGRVSRQASMGTASPRNRWPYPEVTRGMEIPLDPEARQGPLTHLIQLVTRLADSTAGERSHGMLGRSAVPCRPARLLRLGCLTSRVRRMFQVSQNFFAAFPERPRGHTLSRERLAE